MYYELNGNDVTVTVKPIFTGFTPAVFRFFHPNLPHMTNRAPYNGTRPTLSALTVRQGRTYPPTIRTHIVKFYAPNSRNNTCGRNIFCFPLFRALM